MSLAAAHHRSHWLISVARRPDLPADACLRLWLGRGYWGMFAGNAMRNKITAGDGVAFYAAQIGVVAYANVAAPADELLGLQD